MGSFIDDRHTSHVQFMFQEMKVGSMNIVAVSHVYSTCYGFIAN